VSQPPLIVEAAAYHVDGGVTAGGPFGFWVAADAPWAEVPIACWQNLTQSPDWMAVAPRLIEVVGDRTLVMHDQARLDIVRRHLPDWQPAGVVLTEPLAREVWPGLNSYALTAMGTRSGLVRGDGALRAGAEAQLVMMLVTTMLAATVAPGWRADCNGLCAT
jgi:hypothetical protein